MGRRTYVTCTTRTVRSVRVVVSTRHGGHRASPVDRDRRRRLREAPAQPASHLPTQPASQPASHRPTCCDVGRAVWLEHLPSVVGGEGEGVEQRVRNEAPVHTLWHGISSVLIRPQEPVPQYLAVCQNLLLGSRLEAHLQGEVRAWWWGVRVGGGRRAAGDGRRAWGMHQVRGGWAVWFRPYSLTISEHADSGSESGSDADADLGSEEAEADSEIATVSLPSICMRCGG